MVAIATAEVAERLLKDYSLSEFSSKATGSLVSNANKIAIIVQKTAGTPKITRQLCLCQIFLSHQVAKEILLFEVDSLPTFSSEGVGWEI